MSEMKSSSERALIACGMWLHIGLIGAAALAIGAIRLFEGEASLLSGLPMVVFGGMLAVAGWRRALAILKQAEPASAVAPRPLGETNDARARHGHAVPLSVTAQPEARR
jgi:hypothetical protein